MGEALQQYGATMEDIGHVMVCSYERNTLKMPGVARALMGQGLPEPEAVEQDAEEKGREERRERGGQPRQL